MIRRIATKGISYQDRKVRTEVPGTPRGIHADLMASARRIPSLTSLARYIRQQGEAGRLHNGRIWHRLPQ